MFIYVSCDLKSMTIVAKFAGSCKLCGEEWSKDFDIHYSREPRAICINEKCFNTQKGNAPQSSSGYQRNQSIVTIKPEVKVSTAVKHCEPLLKMSIAKAHDMTVELYPELDVNSHTFGQIRSKFTDQVLSIYFFENS